MITNFYANASGCYYGDTLWFYIEFDGLAGEPTIYGPSGWEVFNPWVSGVPQPLVMTAAFTFTATDGDSDLFFPVDVIFSNTSLYTDNANVCYYGGSRELTATFHGAELTVTPARPNGTVLNPPGAWDTWVSGVSQNTGPLLESVIFTSEESQSGQTIPLTVEVITLSLKMTIDKKCILPGQSVIITPYSYNQGNDYPGYVNTTLFPISYTCDCAGTWSSIIPTDEGYFYPQTFTPALNVAPGLHTITMALLNDPNYHFTRITFETVSPNTMMEFF